MISSDLLFKTLAGLLRRRAAERPEREALLFLADGEREEARLTYADLDRRARAIARVLRESLDPGDRALLLYPPGLDFIAAFFGCLYAGVVAVPAYPPRPNDRSRDRLRAIAHDAEPRAALTASPFSDSVRVPGLGALRWIATDALEEAAGEADLAEPDPESLAFLQYTSGSTATPKGVMVSHANLLHNERMIGEAFGQDEDSVVVGWLPLYHDMGLIGNVLQPLHAGARCVLMSPVAFLQRPRRWLEAIGRYRGTTSGGPDFAYELCVRKVPPGQREGLDLSSWRVAFNGAEPVRAGTLERFAEAFAPHGFRRHAFYPCYGLAEATLFVAGGDRGRPPRIEGETARRLVSCGHAWEGQRIAIVNAETGTELPPGREGEIWISGPSVAQGYWRNPEATERDFRARLASGEGPFLRTGDLGFLHPADHGELFVTGRIKDLVIIRGRNHYPQDLELTAERSHPDLRPGCGAAFAMEVDGEERLVVVQEVERHRRAGFEELAEAVRRAISEEHEVQVHEVALVRAGTVPKTSSGKVQRGLCRQRYRAGELALLGRSALGAASSSSLMTRDALLALEPEERQAALEFSLRERAAAALGVPTAAIDPRRPLTGFGLDSLSAVEIRGSVEAALGVSLTLTELLEGLSTEGIAERLLVALRNGEDTPAPRAATVEAGDLPLSYGQKALWFLHRLAPEGGAYNIAVAARARAGLDAQALRRSLEALALRHPALRSVFPVPEGGEEPVRRVLERPEIDFQEETGEWSEARLAEEAYRPFSLEHGPLVRVRVFNDVLLLVVHHIAADFASFAVAARELAAGGVGPPLQASYTDFVRWQEELLAGPRGERLWDFWRQALSGVPDLDLPADRPRPPVQTWRGGARALALPPDLADGVRALAAERGATLFTTLLAAFQAQLGRISGQHDLAVGSPISGRSLPELAPLMGYFVNAVALRADLSGDPTFGELLERTLRTALAGLEHGDFPLALLAERLRPAHDATRPPLFQVMFLLQRPRPGDAPGLATFALGEAGGRIDLGGLELESMRLEERRAQLDLTLRVAEEAGGRLRASLEYNAGLFDGATAERMLGHFRMLLAGAVADPARRISQLPLLTLAERQQLLVDWNTTEALLPSLPLHALFEAQAARTPRAEALVAGSMRTTYKELNRRANRLARHLRGLGVGPEVRVGVRLERTTELVVSLLAVFKSGGAYVPLDPGYPPERLETMQEDSGVRVVISHEDLDRDREVIAGYDASNPEPVALLGNLAYLIYTSGSTGRPKAVAIEHRSAAALAQWARRVFTPEELAGVLASTSATFDLSVFELLVPLCWGGRVILAANVLELPRLPAAGEVTLVNTVPSAMAELARSGGVPRSVRTVNLAGEPVPPALVDAVHGLPGVERLYNLYGPSEDTTYSTFTRLSPGEPVSIGRPVDGTRAYVVDPALEPVPVGVPGELLLGGAGLARGYLGRPELTAERFVPDPFTNLPGARLYRSGDLVRRRPDGELEFLGRIDHQVKVRGFRIELGEVEAALARHPGVREAVVTAPGDIGGGRRLVAYVVPREGDGPPAAELRAFLGRTLPEFMVPSAFMTLAALPLSPNGKVDRKALPAPEAVAPEPAGAPATPLEELLAGAMAEALGLERMGTRDDFFALGGHSLLAARVTSRIARLTGIDLPVSALFREPTAAGLAARIARLRSTGPAAPPLRPAPRAAGPLPLSFAQRRLWFLDRLEPGAAAYNLPGAVDLAGPLDAAALAASLAEIARRHEALRTVFPAVDGEPVQVVAPAGLDLPRVDLAALPAGVRRSEEERLTSEEARRPFDLTRGPVCRTRLLRLGDGEHRLLVVFHHIAADGWSLEVFLRELGVLYEAFAAGGPSPLPDLPVQYVDYAVWQREQLRGGALEDRLAWWRERLAGLPALELSADRPRPPVLSGLGGSLPIELPLARGDGATPFMVLLAAFLVLLHRHTGQDDLAVGAPVANRNRWEVEPLIGFFANTLVLRVQVGDDPTFRALLARTREATLGVYDHHDTPFETLVEELAPERDRSRTPLVQVALALQPAPRPPRLPGLDVALTEVPTGTAKFDLALLLAEHPGGISGRLEYRADLFDEATTRRLAAHLGELLAGAVREPERRLSDLPLLTAAERRQLLEWSSRDVPFPRRATIHGLFEEQAALRPDAVAVQQGDEQWTYDGLDARADRLARRLRRLGVGPESRVGLRMERSLALVAGMLAALKAGGAYVPLDPTYPAERLALLLEDAAPAAVITARDLEGLAELAEEAGTGPEVGADSLAYVLYTSGSTGRPKGVEVPHRAVVRLVRPEGESGHARCAAGEVFLHLAPPAFDAATLEVWGPLLSGGRLVVLPGRVPALAAIGETVARHGVTTLWLTAGLFHLMVEERLADLRPLRRLLAGGDVLQPAHVRRALAALEGGELINGYGPTENTTFTCCHVLQAGSEPGETVPIGRPIAGTTVHLLDRSMRPVPAGVPGELYAGGDGLARGYLGRPELTAERFVPDPNSSGGRLYRTGDLARWRADGAVEFLGRLDQQVKIRGFRVEPGEVEAELTALPEVAAAAVVPREDLPGGRGLVAFVVLRGPEDAPADLAAALRARLKARLPEPLVPALFVALPELPLNANGKVDRRALARRALAPVAAGQTGPRTPTEEVLAALWAQALGRETVGVEDDFFALGGHSLLAARLASRVCEAFGVDLPLARVFELPTVAGLAREIDAASRADVPPEPIRPVPRGPATALPLSFAQERLWVLDRLQGPSAVYNVPLLVHLCGALRIAELAAAFGAIVRRHETLRTTFSDRDSEPAQSVAEAPREWSLPVVDLGGLPAAAREPEALALAGAEARRPFDLAAGPVLRTLLLRLAPEEHLLLVDVHHIAADGWSMGLLVRELRELYGGQPASLPELPVQYADFALWQRRRLSGEILERETAWWRERLRDLPAGLDLPADRPRPAVRSPRGDEVPIGLGPDLSGDLAALARREEVTPFMVLLGGFAALLSSWSGRSDLAVGMPVAGRDRAETADLIGFFVNTLVLRCDLGGDPDFRTLLRRVRRVALDAWAHQELPFERLVDALQPRRDPSRPPLFQVALALQGDPLPPLELAGLTLEPRPLSTRTAKFDLTLNLRPGEDGFAGSLEIAADLFDRATASRLCDRLRGLLRDAVDDPGRPLSRLAPLPAAERRQILAGAVPPDPGPAAYLPPRDDLESTLAATWREVLGRERVGVRESFFEIGGNSLAMVRLHSRLCRALGREVPIATLFQYPTIEGLARHLAPAEAQPEPEAARARPAPLPTQAVAVVGLAARFPGASSVAELWRNLRQGVESISSFTAEELVAAGVDPRLLDDPHYVRAKGALRDADRFDAAFFGLTPREAEQMDPQHRVFLQCAWEALEDAGCDPRRHGGRVGVYAGSGASSYLISNLLPHRDLAERAGALQLLLLNDRDFLATRVAFALDLKGPGMAVQTACSTSLVAIHLARQALLLGECDLALAGGVSISTPLAGGYLYQEGSVLSPDGRCRAFDAAAGGSVEGNGCGVVALKRLADALADGDPIYAVVRGSAVTNDGSTRVGFTAPGVEGQATAIADALRIAGVAPETIGYVETHGSGTPLGDPIEIEALTQAFRRAGARGAGFCAVGSVKTKLGHCNAAAGVAGFLQTVLALAHRTLPPSLHFARPNPRIDFAGSPFYVCTAPTPWETDGAARRAGVSAFGLGGTNAHVVLEEAPVREPGDPPSRRRQLLALSARTPEALDAATARLAARLEAEPDLAPTDLADIAWTLQTGRRGFEHRRAAVAHDRESALAALRDPGAAVSGRCGDAGRRPVVFLFPGLGDHGVDMAREVYETEPFFRGEVDLCAARLEPWLGCDLREALFSAALWSPAPAAAGPDLKALLRRDGRSEDAAAARLQRTELAQPACFVVEYALARLLMHWGVQPQAMIGYSLGEYVAACLAGVLSLNDALALVARRAKLIQALPPGAMLAVPLPEEDVRPLLDGADVSLCATNGPHFCVVGGPEAAVGEVERRLAGRGASCLRLRTTHAFHSAMMEPAAAALTALSAAVETRPPRIPYLSNVTGSWITESDLDPDYWARHMRRTVRFAEGLGELLREPGRAFLEVGPGGTLATLVRQHPDAAADLVAVPTLGRAGERRSDAEGLLAAVGRLWTAGVEIDWQRFHDGDRRRRVSLPTYPFEGRRFWIDPPRALTPVSSPATPPTLAGRGAPPPSPHDFPPLPGWEGGGAAGEGGPGGEGSTKAPRPDLATPYVAPRDATEETLAGIWRELFGVEPVGVEDSFLDLGGHSLLAIQMTTQIRGAFDVELPVTALFETPTVAGLAAEVARARREQTPEDLEEILGLVEGLSPEEAARWVARETGTLSQPAQPPPVLPVSGLDGVGDWPLSFDQERLLRLHADDPRLVSWNVDAGTRILGPLDLPALLAAFGAVVRRHAAWRAAFPVVDGRRVQRVAPSLPPATALLDLTALPRETREPAARRALFDRTRAVFDLERGPLVRLTLARLGATEHLCQITVHHLVTDWITFQTCWRELLPLYEALRASRPLELPPLPAQYPDYVLWEREWLQGAVLDEYAGFWRRELEGFPLALELPADRPRPPVQSQRGGLHQIRAGASRSDRLRALARRENATMFMAALAVLDALLHRVSGLDKLVVGSNSANRARPELEPVFGLFLSQVPFAADLTGDPTFRELLGRVRKSALSAYTHQSFPFSKLVEALAPEPDPARSPVVQVLLLVLEGHSHLRAGDLELQAVPLFDGSSRWDLMFGVYDYPDVGLSGPLEYNADLFDAATVERLLDLFYRLIDAVTEDPDVRLSRLPGLGEAAERQTLAPRPRLETAARIPRVSGPDGSGDWPLSFDQERLWFLDRLDPESAAYNLLSATRIEGDLDVASLIRALGGIVRHQAAWRATFPAVDGAPVQRVAPEADLPLPVVDLAALPRPVRERAALELAREAARRPFALDRGPLARAGLLRLGAREHVCLVAVHHIVADWWTFQLFWRELAALQSGLPLPELPVHYPDFVVWQRGRLRGEALDSSLAWWRERLEGFPRVLDLPADRPRPATESMRGGRLPVRLDPEPTRRLRELSRREGATRFMAVTAVCAALFHRLSGQDRLITGTLHANRDRAEFEPLFGFFLTQLPLAVDLTGDPPFRELLARVRATALEVFAHRDLPFGKLVEALQPERELGRMPLVQTLVQVIETPTGAAAAAQGLGVGLGGLRLEPLDVHDGNARYDLMFSLFEDADAIHGPLEYNAEIFDAATAARALELFLTLADAAAGDPSLRLSDLPAFPEAARQQVLREWNDTAVETAPPTVVGMFEEQAARTPGAAAWTGDGWSLTYADLDARSRRLARRLRRLGAGPEDLVGIYLERTAELPVALLGVLRSGAAYLPLDVAHPADRRAYILEDAGAGLVLTQESLLPGLPAGVRAVCLDSGKEEIDAAEPLPWIDPESRAYVIYTSGSTGRPKGAEIPHRALAAFVRAMRRLYTVEAGDAMPAITTIAFDLSVPELYLPMLGGGTTPLLGRDTVADGVLLARELDARGATVLQATPATYRLLLDAGWPGRPGMLLLCGAEPLPRDLADRLLPLGRGLWNFYGPTETTVWSTAWQVDDHGPIALGRPIAGTRVHLLDRRLAPVPLGAVGEIAIGGAGLARGYLRRPDLTAERFVPDPFSNEPGARLYRTGDLGRYRPDGLLDHRGRIDHQVKLRGFRIEPGEIEAALRGHPAVADAVAMPREDRSGEPRLVAWLEPAPGEAVPPAAELREHLGRRLPAYMVPAAFVPLPALPRNANGKLDRRALPAPEGTADAGAGYVAPRDEVEAEVAAIWQRLLGVERVGAHDDFFALGGHSLLANRVLAAVREKLGAEVPLRALFQAPTVAGVAAVVRERRERRTAGPLSSIARQPRKEREVNRFPVSFSQLREWILDRLEPGTPAYNVPAPVRVTGPLSVPVLSASLNEIVRRHESLRTLFEAGPEEPLQVVVPRLDLPLEVIDLEAVPAPRREPELRRVLEQDLGQGFDLATGPLLRARVVRLGAEDHAVLFTIHHIVSDGWSIGVFLRELGVLYEAFSHGKPSPLPELPVQVPDYAVWQRRRLQGELLEEQIGYWRERLAGAPPLLELPADRPRPPVRTSRGAELPVALPRPLVEPLQALAARQGTSLFAALLAAFQTLLARLSHQEDVAVGTFAGSRPRAELEGLIGFFVNTLVLRTDLSGDPPFREVTARAGDAALGALAHQEVPFEKLLESLDVPRDASRTPLFQAMLVLQSFPRQRIELSRITLAPLAFETGRSNFDLTLWLEETPEGLAGHVDYSTDLFEEATVVRLLGHLRTLLQAAGAAPEQDVWSLPLLAPGERAQLLESWSWTHDEPAGAPLLHRLVEIQAARTPDAAALEAADGGRLTYAELDRRAGQWASRLRRIGVGPETRVALAAERSPEMLVGMLAILQAGGAYVPLDPAYPRDRLAFMLEDSGAAVLLAQERLAGRLPATEARVLLLDDPQGDLEDVEGEEPSPDHAAYVIYTSGSTGRPKGVVVPHRAIAAYVRTAREYYAVGPADRVLQLGSISFDTSAEEIWPALAAGATLVLRADDMTVSMTHFLREMERLEITLLALQTAFWHEIVAGLLDGSGPPAALRLVAFGGEAALADRVEAWRRRVGPGVRLVNTYGPTEATIVSTYRELAQPEDDPEVPIGRAIPGARVYVVDRRFEPVPPGVAGELMIGGAGVARGYLGRPDVTAERFVPDPWSGVPGARLYRTGDLACFRADGDLLFRGRADRQLKLRGYRIEPGEIEAALRLHPALHDAVVDLRGVRDVRDGDRRLVAWVVARPGAEPPDEAGLRAFLRDRLPEPMVPSRFVPVPALPLTPSGKLDRRALPEPDGARPDLPGRPGYTAPASPLERTVAAVFADLLGVDRVGRDDNFFDLGGHSLLVVRAHQRLRAALGREIPVVDLFRFPTVARLARHLGDREDDPLLRRVRTLARRQKSEGIAILGMAGRFPGANGVEELWANLRSGVDAGTAAVEGVERFDASFFGLSPREAEILDPQLRLFLEHAWEALESAGYVPDEARPEWVGVFAGSGLPAYLVSHLMDHPRLGADPLRLLLANDRDFFATRVAYHLDLRGPALDVQTASSTSLVAVHLACQNLLSGQCTLAVAGGVRLALAPPAMGGGLLPPDGRCRAFDARGQGAPSGSGVGVVVLKRLEDALADGDPIHAVIRGSAYNNDGALKVGYTAPGAEGQAEVVALAQALAGVDPETIAYVEAHGTGTPLGDAIEVAALTRAFRTGTQARGFCALGSVKTNVGHLESAAGVAGLIKATLAVERGEIPPSLHFETPNPEIDFAGSPFYVNTRLRDWPRRDVPRRAGVSSFGMGGTNVHMVLEEAPPREPPGPARPWQLLVLSARTATALERRTDDLADWLERHPEADLADVAHTLQTGRRAFPHRRALVCNSREDALTALRSRDPRRLLDGVQEGAGADDAAAELLLRLGDPQEDLAFLLGALARLWLAGATIDWTGVAAPERRRKLHLPTYPFERERHWIDRPAEENDVTLDLSERAIDVA